MEIYTGIGNQINFIALKLERIENDLCRLQEELEKTKKEDKGM
jgi:hypothetical protein|tara:strand:+ start:480 stop:608 length:129 start_codon:yes stop_codon:yes gene_type:complete